MGLREREPAGRGLGPERSAGADPLRRGARAEGPRCEGSRVRGRRRRRAWPGNAWQGLGWSEGGRRAGRRRRRATYADARTRALEDRPRFLPLTPPSLPLSCSRCGGGRALPGSGSEGCAGGRRAGAGCGPRRPAPPPGHASALPPPRGSGARLAREGPGRENSGFLPLPSSGSRGSRAADGLVRRGWSGRRAARAPGHPPGRGRGGWREGARRCARRSWLRSAPSAPRAACVPAGKAGARGAAERLQGSSLPCSRALPAVRCAPGRSHLPPLRSAPLLLCRQRDLLTCRSSPPGGGAGPRGKAGAVGVQQPPPPRFLPQTLLFPCHAPACLQPPGRGTDAGGGGHGNLGFSGLARETLLRCRSREGWRSAGSLARPSCEAAAAETHLPVACFALGSGREALRNWPLGR